MNIGKMSQARQGSTIMAHVISISTGRMDNFAFATFLFLSSCYLAVNFVLRWMKWAIFNSTGLFGFSLYESHTETIYLTFMVGVTVFVWGIVIYMLAKVIPILKNWVLLFGILYLTTVFIELDAAWYGLSQRHASWAEIELFLTEDLKDHFGIQKSHITHYAAIFSVHFVALLGILVFSNYFVRHTAFGYFKNIRFAGVAAVLTLLLSVDVAGSVYMNYRNGDHWRHLIDRNILSPGITPLILSNLTGDSRDLDAANSDLANIAGKSSRISLPGNLEFLASAGRNQAAQGLKDILILVVEGFNPNFVDAETMPFFNSLKKTAISGRNHYSAGNITAYGILGLTFGEPLNFYLSAKGTAKSAFVDLMSRNGYTSRIISSDLSGYRNMGNYLQNFSRPWIDRKDWWALKEPIAKELGQDGPNFVLSYYAGTHYPYHHDPKYNRFQPEVPEDFIYSSSNLQQFREEIKNRYRNCLLEADSWLRDLLQKINLDQTVVVITGDHGEEFFENGRLSHASNLGEPQIKTPFVLLAPDAEPQTVDGITSHLNVMATALSAAGLGNDMSAAGNRANRLRAEGYAIVVHSNGKRLPNRWAVITKDRKSIVTKEPGGKLRITGLSDLQDRKMEYRSDPDGWRQNFDEVAAFQRFLGKSDEKVVFSLK
jgi:membrane-anchored protein YejM (alkaline phosphatase superfamily)